MRGIWGINTISGRTGPLRVDRRAFLPKMQIGMTMVESFNIRQYFCTFLVSS